MTKMGICLVVLWGLLAGPAHAFELMGERTNLFEKRHYQSLTGDADMDYYILKPANYDPAKKYPLVVTLHGASGHSWAAYVLSFPEIQKAYPAFVLMPRAKVGDWNYALYMDLRMKPITHVMSIIKKMKKEFPIDEKRIYVTGYSMGGYGTFGFVAEYPDFFAAAAPLCGGGDVKQAKNMTSTPIWAFHGALDDNIPVEQSRKMTKAIKDAGGKQVYYKEYPTLGHNVWEQVYQSPEFWNWMFNQKRP